VNDLPRTLLLTASPPGDWGVGAQYLKELLSPIDLTRLSCFALTSHPSVRFDESLALLARSQLSFAAPGPAVLPRSRFIRVFWQHLAFRWQRHYFLPGAVTKAVEFGREQDVQQVWAILESPELFRIATLVADGLRCPLITTVWDPPEGICNALVMDRLSKSLAKKDFTNSIQRSSRIGVISENMENEYQRLNSACKFVVMRHAPPAPASDEPLSAEVPDDDEIRIVFSGSLYGATEFAALLLALDGCAWRIENKTVKVQLLGRHFRLTANAGANIEFLGWRTPEEVSRIIRKATLSYVPYWFDAAFSKSVELCFPTKLTAALCVDCPVFFHGPANSAPAAFLSQFPAGVVCPSLDAKHILASLSELISKPRSMLVAAARLARTSELNSVNFHRRFRWLLTGSEHDEGRLIGPPGL
jgi:hypothetical protein